MPYGSDPSSEKRTSGEARRARVRLPVTSGDDSRARLDIRIDTPGREGLAGTTPASIYKPLRDPETVTLPPDGRPLELQPRWRRDFPIDWPEDHYIARRDFAKFMVLTSLGFFVGQMWIALQNTWRRATGQPPVKRIAAVDELAVGGVLVFHYPRKHDSCLLIRAGTERYLAYSQKCTHLSCAVVPRLHVNPATGQVEGHIHCPCHAGHFDLETGRVLAGPPPRPLPRIILEIRGDGIYAVGTEWRTA